MDMHRKVRAILARPEWNQEKLADRLGVSQSSVNRWANNNFQPKGEARDIINQIYEDNRTDLTSNATLQSDEISEPIKIMVYGQAVAGVCGEFEMNGEALYEIKAPATVTSDDAYGALISGDSMYPRFFDGEVAIAEPRKRVSPGDDVIAQIQIEEHGPPHAFIKKLVRYNSKELVLFQYNPPEDPENPGQKLPEEMRFDAKSVVSVHLVTTRTR